MVVEAREIVPGDGDVVEGVASVDESAITGESAPVIRESGGDRSAVTGGTKVLSDRIVVRITQRPGASFIDRMIALVEGASRRRTPNEIALNILPAALTIVFLLAVAALQPMAIYSHGGAGTAALDADGVSGIVPVSLLVCLIPTTIGALLSAIGIAGTDRLVRRNVLAMSGRAVEAAGDVGTLLLDKTGTVTLGDRRASAFVPVGGVPERALADAAHLSSVADETPEGRSIVVFAEEHHGVRGRAGGESGAADWVPFSARTRMSGVDLDGRTLRKGAVGAVADWVREHGGSVPSELAALRRKLEADPSPAPDHRARDGLPLRAVIRRRRGGRGRVPVVHCNGERSDDHCHRRRHGRGDRRGHRGARARGPARHGPSRAGAVPRPDGGRAGAGAGRRDTGRARAGGGARGGRPAGAGRGPGVRRRDRDHVEPGADRSGPLRRGRRQPVQRTRGEGRADARPER
ncbi:P-type ATPase [Actinomadura algeriensis]|uniref:P-type ATPase A domain-containing protein n=1 Tax=Actinomadura algeriensis TaxID=1679523 RepID=A0ABR9K5G1_9ACTN|nr:hypothetical protein [Actinomadura algeriensis]